MRPSETIPGSFSMSERIRSDIEARARPASPVMPQPIPEADLDKKVEEAVKLVEGQDASTAPKEKTQQEKDAERLMEIKASIEKRLEIKLTEDDLSEYILKGAIKKEITIIPEMLKGVFRTLSTAELQDIDEHMRELNSKEKYTSGGLDNERVMVTLSRSWIGIRQKKKSDKWSGSPLEFGKDVASRSDILHKMGAMTVHRASEAWTNLNTLLNIAFDEDSVLKK